jgi:hypothetical protein
MTIPERDRANQNLIDKYIRAEDRRVRDSRIRAVVLPLKKTIIYQINRP